MQPTLITPPSTKLPLAVSSWVKQIWFQFPGEVPVDEPQMDTFLKAALLRPEVT